MIDERPYFPRPISALLSLLLPLFLLWQLATAVPAAAQTCTTPHVVQPGDNLFRLSLQYGVSADAIARFNSLPNVNAITADQTLCIPSAATGVAGTFAFSAQPVWESQLAGKITSLAWGDVDNDGDLDLAVGGSNFIGTNPQEPQLPASDAGQPNYLYLNENGSLNPAPVWTSPADSTHSLAWGDANGDGFLDLAVGNDGQNAVYFNRAGVLDTTPAWQSADAAWTSSIAWGDLNGDGMLDLLAKNNFTKAVAYHNQPDATPLSFSPQPAPTDDRTLALLNNDDHETWGDVNNDNQPDRIRALFGFGLDLETAPSTTNGFFGVTLQPDITLPSAVALGDATGNGRCELAVGEFEAELKLFTLNASGQTTQLWQSQGQGGVEALAWGDVDGDGDLDLAVGGPNLPVRLYQNNTNPITPAATLAQIAPLDTTYLNIWGDSNGDGYYDLLQASNDFSLRVLANSYGRSPATTWQPGPTLNLPGTDIRDAAWGDIDNNQELDLVIARYFAPNQLFRRGDDGVLRPDASWVMTDTEATTAVAWGDVDGDGDLDLAVGNRSSDSIPKSNTLPVSSVGHDQLYLNENGQLASQPIWQSTDTDATLNLNWWDYDADGDLDLIATTDQQPNSDRIYLNEGGFLQEQAALIPHQIRWDSPPRLDVNGDGRFEYAQDGVLYLHDHTPAHPQFINEPTLGIALLPPASIAPATTAVQGSYNSDGQITIDYAITGPTQQQFDIYGFYSLDDGDTWQTAVATPETATRQLTTGQHTYTWDIFGSGVFGASDNTRFRLQVRPSHLPQPNAIPGLYQRPFAQTETLPFRIRGKQVRVFQDGAPQADAVVYRLPAAQTAAATLQTDTFAIPVTTNGQGYLAGRGVLSAGDQLVALWPVPTDTLSLPFTDSYTFFYTSGEPTDAGLNFTEVDDGGVQQLTISETNKLLLFHLNVSLEWDGRNDPLFMLELEDSFKQASVLLYDVTNGQVALGQINLFHNKAYWGQADVVILADNGLRPSAAIGGIVDTPLPETLADGSTVDVAYVPGQVRMGTVWDPYGERTADLGTDWTRALAHELAHYLLFLPDNYLGIDADGILQLVTCPDSFMTTTTDPAYSEFLTADKWQGDCQMTLAAATTGRTDWQTITFPAFYPMLSADRQLAGPYNLPLAVTYLIPWAFAGDTIPLPSRNFDLRSADSTSRERLRLPNGQAYLFQINDRDDPTDDVVLALGAPTGGGDRLKVRGAHVGDRLCVFGSNGGQPYTGCIPTLSATDAALPISQVDANWQPQITVQAVTSRTFTIAVEQPLNADETMQAQLFPLHYGSVPCNAPVAALDSNGRTTLTTRLPAYEVAVRVWVDDDSGREALTTFRLNPPWDEPAPADTAVTPQTDCILTDAQLAALTPVDDLAYAPLAGPNDRPVGGPNDRPVGGLNDRPVGGPNNVPIGGPNDRPVGGPNDRPVGGPNDRPVGGASNSFNAPILSADAQVVVYRAEGFFAPNGVASLQLLDTPPAIDSHSWLTPVGRSYRLVLENDTANRFISFSYLQRDVPEGYEYALTVYFLPEDSDVWQPLGEETVPFPENFVVAPLQPENGTYALMASVPMPDLEPGWNLLAYPMPDCRSAAAGLASVSEHIDGLYLATGDTQAPTTTEIAVQTLQPGRVYWVHNRSDTAVTPYFAPPERRPDGTLLGDCPDENKSEFSGITPDNGLNIWMIGIAAAALIFTLLLLFAFRRRQKA